MLIVGKFACVYFTLSGDVFHEDLLDGVVRYECISVL